jgi:hypothetical protein
MERKNYRYTITAITMSLSEYQLKLEEEQREKQKLKDYKKGMTKFIMTSRFNNATWDENIKYRERLNHNGCIYCCPVQVTQKIAYDSLMFVLEMNNDTNQIIGIGMVKNHPIMEKYKVYENGNYNRYVFVGNTRIDRSNMNEDEESVMQLFDMLCFKGNRHMKRGQGLRSFPMDMLYELSKKLDLTKFVVEMFKRRLSSKQENAKSSSSS